MSDYATTATGLEIAVIGMAGRFPGAANIDEFWGNLKNGVESISRFSDEELIVAGVSPETLADPDYVKAKGILEGTEDFDASFFGYFPKEAETMDPQCRVFLEIAWEALEHAGYDPDRFPGMVGVFAGAGMNNYVTNIHSSCSRGTADAFQLMLGDKDFLSTRVSYKLGLQGPSINMQTACSTSLVAAHLACQSLIGGECDMALAGGVSILLPQKQGYRYQQGMIFSPDGHCRAFDAQAQGAVFGDGAGAVVLKRLEDALEARDTIHAVIRGSAINNDGSRKMGYTAPSVEGQARVIRAAHLAAELDPETIGYVETHGTGTPLGDPIEVEALTQAFRKETGKKGFCALGSLKPNVGHLNAAAGVAGLIKTVLVLKHAVVPKMLHYSAPNPAIDFANSPFFVNAATFSWEGGAHPRRAGVSAFGIGGTNAHLVLEEAPPRPKAQGSRSRHLLLWSARSAPALEQATQDLLLCLEGDPGLDLAEVAYTQQFGRRFFPHRRMLVCRDRDDALSALRSLDPRRLFSFSPEAAAPPAVFMFPGAGPQYVGMARELYESEPFFRAEIDRLTSLLTPHIGLDLREILFASPENSVEAGRLMTRAFVTQPATFVIDYALARLWMDWGITPRGMIGHSTGEFVAACLAGVFTLEDALQLVAARGRLMEEMAEGVMLSVALSPAEIAPLLTGTLCLAAVNAPALCVVSGENAQVEELKARLDAREVEYRQLSFSHAAHSAMMEPMRERFQGLIGAVTLSPPGIPYLSNVTGTWITQQQATDPGYWGKHLCETVQFSAGIRELLREPQNVFLEAGPGHSLSGFLRQHLERNHRQVIVSTLRHPSDRATDTEFLLGAVGEIWGAGGDISWTRFHGEEKLGRVPLPSYPFERSRYWCAQAEKAQVEATPAASLLKNSDIGEWFYAPSWRRARLSVTPAAGTLEKSPLLIFHEAGGGSARLAHRLQLSHGACSLVTPGEGLVRTAPSRYTLDIGRAEDFAGLLKTLQGGGQAPTRILFALGFGDGVPSAGESPYRAFHALMHLAKALGELELAAPLKITVVTQHMQEVLGGEVLAPEQALMAGPCRVIPQELPFLSCTMVDLALEGVPEARVDQAAQRLLEEIYADADEEAVAYRGDYRFVREFEKLRLPAVPKKTGTALRENGVYLVTGGLGGVGLSLAGHLAKAVGARLALLGRSTLPERELWDQWLAEKGPGEETSARIRAVLSLEEAGGEVLVLAGDVAKPEELRKAVAKTLERFGTIHGVIHSAGVAGGGMIQLKTSAQAEEVMAPKVLGTLALEACLSGLPLDFLVLCSSLTSLTGGVGQSDYCSANAFLDAFAPYYAARYGVSAVSVNWHLWQEVGMGARSGNLQGLSDLREEQYRQGMLPGEGVEAFARILEHPLPQVLVSTQDFSALLAQYRLVFSGSLLAGEAQPAPASYQRSLKTAYVAPRSQTEIKLAQIWEGFFGIDPIGVFDNFFELGGNSLVATQIVSRMKKSFNVQLPLAVFFDKKCIADIAIAVEGLVYDYIEGLTEDEACEYLSLQ